MKQYSTFADTHGRWQFLAIQHALTKTSVRQSSRPTEADHFWQSKNTYEFNFPNYWGPTQQLVGDSIIYLRPSFNTNYLIPTMAFSYQPARKRSQQKCGNHSRQNDRDHFWQKNTYTYGFNLLHYWRPPQQWVEDSIIYIWISLYSEVTLQETKDKTQTEMVKSSKTRFFGEHGIGIIIFIKEYYFQ